MRPAPTRAATQVLPSAVGPVMPAHQTDPWWWNLVTEFNRRIAEFPAADAEAGRALWPLGLCITNMLLGLEPLLRINRASVAVVLTALAYGGMWCFFLLSCATDPGVIDMGQLARAGRESEGRWCSTCGFSKPARTKHCRALDRCVAMHDHYCPFLYNCIGRNNFAFFYLYVLFHCLSEFGFLVLCYTSEQSGVLAQVITTWIGLFSVPGFGMLLWHSWLLMKNVTTNENKNFKLYGYLLDRNGEYQNPFDAGFITNVRTRILPRGDIAQHCRDMLPIDEKCLKSS